jgi:hypothetical protein
VSALRYCLISAQGFTPGNFLWIAPVSGALLLLFVVAWRNWITGSLGVLLIHDVSDITISRTEVGVTVKPL